MTLQEKIEKMQAELDQLKEEAKRDAEFKDYATCIEEYYGQFTEGKVYKIKVKYSDRLCFSQDDEGTPNGLGKRFFRPSTPKEIEKHLIAEAEKKGFVKGARVRHGNSYHIIDYFFLMKKKDQASICCNRYFEDNGIHLAVSSGIASFPLPESELFKSSGIKIGEHEVEIFPNHIQVGCTRVDLETINKIYNHFHPSTIIAKE